MFCVQADTLGAATHLHLLEGVSETVHTFESTDDIAECMLNNLPLDGWVIVDDVRKDGSEAGLCQHLLADQHLLAIGVLQVEQVLCIWQHNDMRVVVEGSHQQ